MLPSQKEPWGKSVSPELDIQKMPQPTVAAEKASRSNESIPATDAKAAVQFRFRILVVDDEPSIRETAEQILRSEGYEVLTAADGLDGLHALSKSLPDVIISDLNMPRMSGFEFLAIVRKRFPHIATIAMSGEYITGKNPSGILADAFLQKGHYTIKELFQEIARLLTASPIRSEREKSDVAPLFVPRDNAGYLIITCPKCLRPNKLEAMSLNGGIHQTLCQTCGTPVRFEINHEVEPLMKKEFQSANEEILSANEELQSSNEELETSREELQSANEELTTLNDELRNRNLELGQLNNDLNNLLSSTTLPVVMVDRGLHIRRATSASGKVFKIFPSDIGRPISDIRSNIAIHNLEKLIAEVIDTLATKELDVHDKDDRWYSLQIRPYRTADDKIDGAVLVLTDISVIKSASERFKRAKEFAEGVIDTVREPLLVLDSDLRVRYANPAFFEAFKVSREETERKFLYRLGNEQWNIPKLRALVEKVASDDTPVKDIEVAHDFPGIGTRTMLLNARRITDAHGDEPLILLAIEDITERRQARTKLEQSHAELELQVRQRTASLRRLSSRLQGAQDEERRRISRELHDSVGQYLVSVKMNLAQVDQPNLQKAKAALAESDELLDKCLAEIRTISHLLHPPLLDESGLVSAAKWYVEGFGKRSSIQTNLDISPHIERLPQAVEMALFRSLQETLTNVHRHSGSPKVDVRIELEDGQVGLIVRDYGRGIATKQLEQRATGVDLGVGLTGMRERVTELGGNLQVLSENPGTLVRVTVPAGPEQAETGRSKRSDESGSAA
jgi:PAS domain S-box-containing protein